MTIHPTIERLKEIVADGKERAICEILAENVQFQPPTYYKTWTGRKPVAAILGHVGHIFSNFKYRRVFGRDQDWALEFHCNIGDLNAVGVDLITLNEYGLISRFEVVMRPHKTIGALREAMNARIMNDVRFMRFKSSLT